MLSTLFGILLSSCSLRSSCSFYVLLCFSCSCYLRFFLFWMFLSVVLFTAIDFTALLPTFCSAGNGNRTMMSRTTASRTTTIATTATTTTKTRQQTTMTTTTTTTARAQHRGGGSRDSARTRLRLGNPLSKPPRVPNPCRNPFPRQKSRLPLRRKRPIRRLIWRRRRHSESDLPRSGAAWVKSRSGSRMSRRPGGLLQRNPRVKCPPHCGFNIAVCRKTCGPKSLLCDPPVMRQYRP